MRTGPTILIVDDDANVRWALSRLLEECGYEGGRLPPLAPARLTARAAGRAIRAAGGAGVHGYCITTRADRSRVPPSPLGRG